MTDLLKKQDVAKKFGVSSRTVANWLKKGLPYFKLGTTVRVSPADLESWINKNKRVSLSPLTPELVEALHGGPPMAVFRQPKCRTQRATCFNS